ncbi:MAG: hypothetical protein EOP48_21470, partial [Sphingobacteriales bacterium]
MIFKHLRISLLGLIATTSICYGQQKKEAVVFSINYAFTHIADTNNPDRPIKENMTLDLGPTTAKYHVTFSEAIKASRKLNKPGSERPAGMRIVTAVGLPMAVVIGPGITNVELFQHPADGKLNTTATIGRVSYVGTASGYLSDFAVTGSIQSDIGNVKTDIKIKLPVSGPTAYSGKLASPGFNIGKFLDNDQFGKIALDGNVHGQGFSLNELNVNFDGNVSKVDWGTQTFSNIYIVGDFEKKFFKGHLTIDDPKVQIKSLDGTISLSGKEMNLNADADITYIDLFKLGISKKDLRLSGLFSLNFTGNNIDDFLGTARVYNASLRSDSTRLSFDFLTLNSSLNGDRKVLSLQSNELDVLLDGKFNIRDLPNSFTFFLSRYYPAYIKKPRYAVSNQDFNFSIKTKDVTDYLGMIDPRFTGFNNSELSGNINLINSELKLKANVPDFSFNGKSFNNVQLNGTGNFDTLTANLSASSTLVTITPFQ